MLPRASIIIRAKSRMRTPGDEPRIVIEKGGCIHNCTHYCQKARALVSPCRTLENEGIYM